MWIFLPLTVNFCGYLIYQCFVGEEVRNLFFLSLFYNLQKSNRWCSAWRGQKEFLKFLQLMFAVILKEMFPLRLVKRIVDSNFKNCFWGVASDHFF